jgi:UDPglucose--hexose-1-phosphate uridylyltransferase
VTEEELESCPFCAGREDRTPPETLTIGDPWRVRVVPNLYPAFERQEVVVHAPEHARSIAELPDEQIDLVAEAWQRRRAAHPEGYLHALINEGRIAGSSLPHTHSQLVWLAETPPGVARERELGAALDAEVIVEDGGVVAVSPHAGRVPYEALIAPTEPEDDPWTSSRLAPALRTLADLVRRLHKLGGPVPLNAWLHAGPWWHVELFPRLTVLAGIELGAEIYVNTVAPEEAAAQLREASERRGPAGELGVPPRG